jgi:hypothetical protein
MESIRLQLWNIGALDLGGNRFGRCRSQILASRMQQMLKL